MPYFMYVCCKFLFFIAIFLCTSSVYASETKRSAVTHSMVINELQGHENFAPPVRDVIDSALSLTRQNLTYLFGSADPKRNGMDCSGTIYYLLKAKNIQDVPRDAHGIYKWVVKNGKFHYLDQKRQNMDLSGLKPGDLLFWSGTYSTKSNSSISHVMLYLGKDKNNRPLMVGSSNGRTYKGKSMWGVSVFDFKLPPPGARSKFIGYSCIPQLTCDVT